MIKVVTIVGARPQFIKSVVISRAIRDGYGTQVQEVLVHTGQHFDHNMSEVFFEELGIPAPKYDLRISGGTHGAALRRRLGRRQDHPRNSGALKRACFRC